MNQHQIQKQVKGGNGSKGPIFDDLGQEIPQIEDTVKRIDNALQPVRRLSPREQFLRAIEEMRKQCGC